MVQGRAAAQSESRSRRSCRGLGFSPSDRPEQTLLGRRAEPHGETSDPRLSGASAIPAPSMCRARADTGSRNDHRPYLPVRRPSDRRHA